MSSSSSDWAHIGRVEPFLVLLGRNMQAHSDGSDEDVGRIVAAQSSASPSRNTWTNTRFATWFPESLVPRAGHRGDRTFYLICLSGFNHQIPPFYCSTCCSLPLSASAGPGSPQKNPLQKTKGGSSASVCDYYKHSDHSWPPIVTFA